MEQVSVVFASQTGTAQEYAAMTVRQLWQAGYSVKFTNIDRVRLEDLLKMRVCLIVIATCGQGELPASSRSLWNELLDRRLPSDILSPSHFGVLGLGDSSYEHFNYAAKKLYRRLEQLGGRFLMPRVLADEQSPEGLDEGYGGWIRDVVERLVKIGMPCGGARGEYCMYKLERIDEMEQPDAGLNGKVTMNQHLTPVGFEKSVRLIRMSGDVGHSPGDVALVYPQNQDDDIHSLCKRLDWRPSESFIFTPNRPDAILPASKMSIYALLKHHLDIYSHPKRSFFKILSGYATNQMEADKLAEIGSSDYDLYLDYCVRPKRTPTEILADFGSVANADIDWIFDLFPLIRPRSFSIASWSSEYIDIVIALVKYRTRWIAAPREGLASRFLDRVETGHHIRFEVVAGEITQGAARITQFDHVILVGAGTGIAPLRSIVQYIDILECKPQVYIFYGCRSLCKDNLFQSEFENTAHIHCHTLGSRDNPPERLYIDHLLRTNAGLLKELLVYKKSIVFLSGNNHLPKLVRGCIDEITGIAEYSKTLQHAGRYYYECWSS